MNLDLGSDLFLCADSETARVSVRVPGRGGSSIIRSLECSRIEGAFYFEGDIIVRAAPLFTVARHSVGTLFGHGVKDRGSLWKNGVVPFAYDAGLDNLVLPAISHFMERTPIRFTEFAGEPDCINFQHGAQNGSQVGCVGGLQTIWLRPDTTVGTAVHEIGHALGLWHEHSRSDRDSYITLHPENYRPRDAAQFEQPIRNAVDLGPYDTGSIMHYPSNAFSKNGGATITLKAGGSIGQREGLSAGDIAAIKQLYSALA